MKKGSFNRQHFTFFSNFKDRSKLKHGVMKKGELVKPTISRAVCPRLNFIFSSDPTLQIFNCVSFIVLDVSQSMIFSECDFVQDRETKSLRTSIRVKNVKGNIHVCKNLNSFKIPSLRQLQGNWFLILTKAKDNMHLFTFSCSLETLKYFKI